MIGSQSNGIDRQGVTIFHTRPFEFALSRQTCTNLAVNFTRVGMVLGFGDDLYDQGLFVFTNGHVKVTLFTKGIAIPLVFHATEECGKVIAHIIVWQSLGFQYIVNTTNDILGMVVIFPQQGDQDAECTPVLAHGIVVFSFFSQGMSNKAIRLTGIAMVLTQDLFSNGQTFAKFRESCFVVVDLVEEIKPARKLHFGNHQ
mmetsp:Transcript_21209/g.39594  ORF Transcript_21209/g.39594 Transcript_21209/m.39594 type:complete len:200 (+) Transcript_21209:640-1239(+)